MGCADKVRSKPDSDIFNVWKAKLLKHEEKCANLASQAYRNQKRQFLKEQKLREIDQLCFKTKMQTAKKPQGLTNYTTPTDAGQRPIPETVG